MKKNFKLSSPWVEFYNEIEALFLNDPDVQVEYDEETPEVKLLVDGQEKADALTQLLPTQKVFGKVVLKITVVPSNEDSNDVASLIRKAFKGNPALAYVLKYTGDVFRFPVTYAVFAREVVQYFNDNLNDFWGNRTTLYQDIAKNVFSEIEGVFFCTEPDEDAEVEEEAEEE